MKSWNINKDSIKSYIKSCVDSVSDDIYFDNFKRNPDYTAILEHQHLPKEYGDLMINSIESKYDKDKLKSKIDGIKDNDKHGNPILFNFEYGDISLGTLRYVKNSCDIVSYFGESDIDDIDTIVEIGGGYGGLCKTISNFIDYKNYYLFDLKEVNLLSSRYLSNFDNFDKIHINTIEDSTKNFIDGEVDLLISNYAISEIPKSLQMIYIDKILLKSNRFYIIYNHLQSTYDEDGMSYNEDGMSYNEFINLLSDKFDIETENDIDSDLVKIIFGRSKKFSK